MKRIILSVLTVAGLLLAAGKTQAQTTSPLKIGVFDIDYMVQAMPGYPAIDSAVQVYERDTLGAEYEIYQMEYHRLDSTYKVDSAAGKPAAILDYTKQQLQQMAFNLIYWQQIAQNKSDAKRGQLSAPLYQAVGAAYKKVLDTKKYTLILKPNTYELGSTAVENIFPLVAKELNVPLPEALGGAPQQGAGGIKPQQ